MSQFHLILPPAVTPQVPVEVEKPYIVYVEKNLTEGTACSCRPGFYSPDAGERCACACAARLRACVSMWTCICVFWDLS